MAIRQILPLSNFLFNKNDTTNGDGDNSDGEDDFDDDE